MDTKIVLSMLSTNVRILGSENVEVEVEMVYHHNQNSPESTPKINTPKFWGIFLKYWLKGLIKELLLTFKRPF